MFSLITAVCNLSGEDKFKRRRKKENIKTKAQTVGKFSISEIMEQAADKMFSSTADFLRTELNSAMDDFKLLQSMNKAALHKYKDLTQTTQVR